MEDLSTKLLTSNSTTTTAASLTPQDLAQMFPTPPSQEPSLTAMSPTSASHNDIQITGNAPVIACMSFLSPEMHHTVTVCENDDLEINLESKSPICVCI